jgi:hypothetical protein
MNERTIERIFYHDLLNLASSLRGIAEVIADVDEATRGELLALLGDVSETLIETINARRLYRSMETQDLSLNASTLDCEKLLQQTAARYKRHTLCQDKAAEIRQPAPPSSHTPISLVTDKDVLQGALGYAIRTALAIIPRAHSITLDVTREASGLSQAVVFSISFPGTLSKEENELIFKKPQADASLTFLFPAYVFHTLITTSLHGRVNCIAKDNALLLTARFEGYPSSP